MLKNTSGLFDLVNKYNVAGPRYTSYPTAVQFTEEFPPGILDDSFSKRAGSARPLSLYFHIPFCFSLCWYCGCTKIITRDQDRGDLYIEYLQKEISLVQNTIHPDSPVQQIHLGGGTPTFLSAGQLQRLGDLIHSNFTIHRDVEFSVEIDPRRCGEEQIMALKKIGCNRASLGVQDTNHEVQRAIHRIQPFEETQVITNLLRKHDINKINVDLIYGLPKQTPDTFSRTIDDVAGLAPDRFAIYSYAHLPSLMPAQKLLNENEFPSSSEKLDMIITAIERLPELGYHFIGMDHFAREDDELTVALENGTLQRNFQGYSTRAKLEMIAFGMSGISQGDELYYQNEKDLARYYAMLDDGKLPVNKVLQLTEEDKIRRAVIMQVMCRASIHYESFYEETGIRFREFFANELDHLKPMEADGLLLMLDDRLAITDLGRLFIRNIAMVFDQYLTKKKRGRPFSSTV
ncbi:MAG: oxygen-independent coproporphyrinogen III oxidase [Bacteroidetes bacterium]|jgi:oxygen-independent coproporphyrinogen-3 oxidase|nr:oxygen-independent coproporphyrinogen III oxidase [Bacteroidota bacterium]